MAPSGMVLANALHVASAVLVLVVHLAVLLVGLAVVRPRRAGAGAAIAAGAGMMLLGDVASWGSWMLFRYFGMEAATFFAVTGMLHALWGAAAWGVLLLGIVQLSRPPANAGV